MASATGLQSLKVDAAAAGAGMIELMARLLPMPRSITGEGFRATQRVLQEMLPTLQLEEIESGTEAFDWTIPLEWNIRSAYIKDSSGKVIVDFADNPLHVLNYSVPVNRSMSLEELKDHLFSDPDHPDAIPYRTSYYEDAWGFCLPHRLVEELEEGTYEVLIDADKSSGVLNYGEVFHPGDSEDEFLFTAHACHPGQCNDNLSGVAVLASLAALIGQASTNLSFRFLFLPGGIGSVAWLHKNRERVDRVKGGLSLSCLGDSAPLRFKATYNEDSWVDRAMTVVFRDGGWESTRAPFEPYGFDERNFNTPGFRIPFGSLTRSPHGGYPGYHSSEDNLDSMSADKLGEALQAVLALATVVDGQRRCLNESPHAEPQLGKRGLYPSVGGVKERRDQEMALLWLMSMSDGENTLVDIALRSGLPFEVIAAAADSLTAHGLLIDT